MERGGGAFDAPATETIANVRLDSFLKSLLIPGIQKTFLQRENLAMR